MHAACTDEAGRGSVMGPMVYGIAACPIAFEDLLNSRCDSVDLMPCNAGIVRQPASGTLRVQHHSLLLVVPISMHNVNTSMCKVVLCQSCA